MFFFPLIINQRTEKISWYSRTHTCSRLIAVVIMSPRNRADISLNVFSFLPRQIDEHTRAEPTEFLSLPVAEGVEAFEGQDEDA